MTSRDDYTQWDAAYVLGALSAAERAEFEEHLAGCSGCRRAVSELAGVPGLLAQVPASEALAGDRSGDALLGAEPPASLMPLLPPEPAARWRWAVPAAAAAAGLVVGGLGGYALSGVLEDRSAPPAATPSAGPVRLAFSPVSPSPITAVVDLLPSATGTRVRVECQYALATSGTDPQAWSAYAVWVVDRDGNEALGKTWTARPNRVMRPTADSPLRLSQIAAVEIRRVDNGQTLLRARLA